MGCKFSSNKENRDVKINVGEPLLFLNHKDITKWERGDYKKRMKANNTKIFNLSKHIPSL